MSTNLEKLVSSLALAFLALLFLLSLEFVGYVAGFTPYEFNNYGITSWIFQIIYWLLAVLISAWVGLTEYN